MKIQNKKLLQMMEFSNILIIEVKIWGIAGLYNEVTIIIETDNPYFKVRRNAKYFVSWFTARRNRVQFLWIK